MQSLNIQQNQKPEPIPETINDYLVLSIISIFLCTIGGIIATVYSVKTRNHKLNGDYILAAETSKKALNWLIISFVISGFAILGRFAGTK
jgi:hypothetical protein